MQVHYHTFYTFWHSVPSDQMFSLTFRNKYVRVGYSMVYIFLFTVFFIPTSTQKPCRGSLHIVCIKELKSSIQITENDLQA